MGSIQDSQQNGFHLEEKTVSKIGNVVSNGASNGVSNGVHIKTYQLNGLASKEFATPTGLREDVVLLSWLLVLLRTGDQDDISFEWAYNVRSNGLAHEATAMRLSMKEVISETSSSVGEIATSISSQLPKTKSDYSADATSLLLSTRSLSKTSENSGDEGALHLELEFDQGHLSIQPVWYSQNVLSYTIDRYISTLTDIIKTCLENPTSTVDDCMRPTTHDLEKIWEWNHELPPSYNFGMHELISERALSCPDKTAIASWDGSLTYAQIEQYSTLVAHELGQMGVKLHDIVPVCFEKSRWTVVAVLGVMKAGATFALMDPTLPLARLQNIATQVRAQVIVSSRKQHHLAASILPEGKSFVVEADTFERPFDPKIGRDLQAVPGSALMYIIFTSGSTGVPKGVMISHETYTSSAIPRARAVGYTEESRVLDFASYAFDVSIDSMLCTLAQGGCLCIPSDEDRMNDINGVMRAMQVNYAGLTPSVARILDPDVIASLTMLGLGGEASTARDITNWGRETRIVIGYGPCECTIGCTVNSDTATGRDYVSIGKGTGAVMWIVDPNNHEVLMPVGAVGELLVEGPIVGQGYLNDPAKTAAAFIEDPSWLKAGYGAYSGRQGRLYKTGDLGKYDPDGSGGIVFVGRKDTQVKLRGQRVELGEIEYQLKTILPTGTNVIAEVVVPAGSGGQPSLVAFVASQSAKQQEKTDLQSVQPDNELGEALSKASEQLAKVVPRYMVPTAYIPVNYIPVLISGKTDRKTLRQFASTVELRQLDQNGDNSGARELSDLERQLQQVWGQTLKIQADKILPDDNFFALGGDSVMAMKLVSACRANGLELTVSQAFLNPKLSAMAEVVQVCSSEAQTEIAPFSMISQDVNSLCSEAAQACGVDQQKIEDIYPCTPTQEGLFTFSLKSVTPYVAQRIASIPEHIDQAAWERAWEEVVAASQILRTRLIQASQSGLWQVVLKEGISWRYSDNLTQYLEDDKHERMDLGQSLGRYAIVTSQDDGKRYMVWTIHHVLYDGWSEPLILEKVTSALKGERIHSGPQIKDLVQYFRGIQETTIQDFWRQELQGAVGPQFPRAPSRDYLATADAILEHQVHLDTSLGSSYTLATLIRGAWSFVVSKYLGSNDVMLIETLSGRDIPLTGVETIEGPLIATIPIRIHVDRNATVESYLRSVQQSMLTRAMYQHFGVQNIRKVSSDAQYACEARTGIVIQPEPEYTGSELGFEHGDVVREGLHFNPYPLMLGFGIQKNGFRVVASFDTSIIDIPQMKRILGQLEAACLQLTRNLSKRLSDISFLPEEELDQIWKWNSIPPLTLEGPSKTLRANSAIEQGSRYPPAVVSWVCDPLNSSLLSPIGCVGELWLESNLLPGEAVAPPAWLAAGSANHTGRIGRVQPTGDLVRLLEDGSLTFMGQKEDLTPFQGRTVDVKDLEAHFRGHLPPKNRAAAAIVQPSDSTGQATEQELIVLIEQETPQADDVELTPASHTILCDESGQENFQTAICAKISLELVVALRALDRHLQDALPPYMVPSTYVVIEKIAPTKEGIDRGVLNRVASKIPHDLLKSVRESMRELWARTPAQKEITPAEKILRSSWARILKVGEETVDVSDNFFRLGGDSVLAMKLVSDLRLQGHVLTVTDIFQHMRLRDAAKVLKVNQVSKETPAEVYKPFSTLERSDVGSFLLKHVRPKLQDSRWSIEDVLPVTDSQALDIRATIESPRTSVQYTMLYLDSSIDGERLLRAWDELVKTHQILRTIFIEHDSAFFQVVVDDLHASPALRHAEGDFEPYILDICKQDIESNFELGSSFARIFYVDSDQGDRCLIIGLSHAQYDGISLPRLLLDLETLYTGAKVAASDFLPFSSYIARTSGNEQAQSKAVSYWRDLLHGSSLSLLTTEETAIAQRTDKPVEITMGSLLAAAWALVLARRLHTSDVTFGSVTSGRLIDLPNIENVVGPCYQFAPVRVQFAPGWTVMDLLRHDFEDFDTMQFAGATCKVDISIPHGDAVHPWKIVTLPRDGQTHVGIVGSEKNQALVETLLDELVAATNELASGQQSTRVLELEKLEN
ncbi:hypothetical protein DV738_g4888, partial [Chaetothyriales sp. CBS 135597]